MFENIDKQEATQNKAGNDTPIIPLPPVNPMDPLPIPMPLVPDSPKKEKKAE